jgi:hypothetical protein
MTLAGSAEVGPISQEHPAAGALSQLNNPIQSRNRRRLNLPTAKAGGFLTASCFGTMHLVARSKPGE